MKSNIDNFWKVLGVSSRVYSIEDIFINTRDKQSDEKKFHRFKNNPQELSDKEYALFFSKAEDEFYNLFTTFFGFEREEMFYVHQILNISFNIKFLQNVCVDEKTILKLVAFQITYIMEHMNKNKFDIHTFYEAVTSKSFKPFISYAKEMLEIKTNIELAQRMSNTSYDLEKIHTKIGPMIKCISPSTYAKRISRWNQDKELPSFIDMLIITNTLFKNSELRNQKISFFFQTIIVRSLLFQKENLSENEINDFLTQFKKFREKISTSLEKGNIHQLQKKILYPISEAIDKNTFEEIVLDLKNFYSSTKYYSPNNGKTINLEVDEKLLRYIKNDFTTLIQ
ncbi:MAG: hypothetical protein DRG78_14670 [Epsilonproteobacteria bacterium]|nr:MAG: hypothetical protein DRG78_14670 [Campylobacterota bacterium]